jgi:hypothetical protein
MLAPQPTEGATRINEPSTATIKNGEKATFTFDADGRTNDLIIPIVAMSKLPGFVYELRSDGTDRYGPARIPPTDIDDLSVCFLPALRFSDKLTVEISNVANNERVAHVQLIGWEAADGA